MAFEGFFSCSTISNGVHSNKMIYGIYSLENETKQNKKIFISTSNVLESIVTYLPGHNYDFSKNKLNNLKLKFFFIIKLFV